MKKILVAILAAVVLAAGAMFIFAQQDGGDKNSRHGFGKRAGFGKRGNFGRGGLMLRGLDLTDAQKAQVKQIMEAGREKNKSVREAARAGRQKLAELTAGGQFDESQVTAVAGNLGAIEAQMIVEKERVKSQIYQILTDEQKAKAAQIKEQMKQRFEERMNRQGKTAPGQEAPTEE